MGASMLKKLSVLNTTSVGFVPSRYRDYAGTRAHVMSCRSSGHKNIAADGVRRGCID